MRILCSGCAAAFPCALDIAHIFFAVVACDKLFGRRDSFFRNTQTIGTHIGDQAHRAVTGNVHAFIQRLGRAHGAQCGKAQAAAGFLLQRTGDKRGRRRFFALALFKLRHSILGAFQLFQNRIGFLLVVDCQLFAVGRSL